MSEILDRIRERFERGMSQESEMREMFTLDYEFFTGDQWVQQTKNKREAKGRPALTVNKISQITHQIVNEQKIHRPEIMVSPGDAESDKKTAEVIKGLIRSIKRRSKAESVHDKAAEAAAICGRGFFRVVTEYSDYNTLNQEIKLKAVYDPLSILLDSSYREIDGSDAKWAFVIEEMDEEEFKRKYPKANVDHSFEGGSYWYGDGTVTIAEYFEIQYEKTTIKNDDGERTFERPVVKHWLTNGSDILEEETRIPCSYIPIIAVHGTYTIYKGNKTIEGVVRQAKDIQRLYNSLTSAESEMVNTMPKASWVGVRGQFGSQKRKWETAHTDPVGVLEYEKIDDGTPGGTPMPPPQRITAEPPIAAITTAKNQCREDFKEVTGVYPSSFGDSGGEVAASAITGRINQGKVSNAHYAENMKKSILHAGKIILEMIPKIYNTKRMVEIVKPSDESELVAINEVTKEGVYFVNRGTYTAEISAGTDYKNKRAETSKTLIDVSKVYPKLFELAGDIVVKNLDISQASEIAERVRRSMPQQILIEEEMTPDQLKGALESALQKNQELESVAEILNQKIESKEIEIQGKNQIEREKLQVETAVERMKIAVNKQVEMEKISTKREELALKAKDLGIELNLSENGGSDE